MSSSEFDHQDSADDNAAPSDNQPLGFGDDAGLLAHQQKNARILWGIFAVLLLIAAGVFFVLPRLVTPPDLSANPGADASRPATSTRTNQTEPAEQISPFEEAQRMRQRSAAQDSLAQLLELQEALEAKSVEQWAAEDYARALELAGVGDAEYREQNFSEANEAYSEALNIFQSLDESLPTVVADLLEQGLNAIESGDAEAAVAAFELVMTVEPASTEADAGLQRALALEDVLAHLETGRELEQAGELEAALEQYEAALTLDAEHKASQDALTAVNQAIAERNFSRHMSQGYSALSNNDANTAEGHFRQALAVKPGSTEAETALVQVRDQISSNAINSHLATAARHETEEDWQAALDVYQKALAVDANVVAAEEGRDRARSRLNLDNYWKELLADPLQLADPVIYERSVETYTNALNIPNGGPRLREQMNQARHYLEEVKRPRSVTLRSDSATSVTLLRVDSLGQFSNTNVQLTPGRYVATGIREGYRDVRVEFVVPFDGQPQTVEVICDQRI